MTNQGQKWHFNYKKWEWGDFFKENLYPWFNFNCLCLKLNANGDDDIETDEDTPPPSVGKSIYILKNSYNKKDTELINK